MTETANNIRIRPLDAKFLDERPHGIFDQGPYLHFTLKKSSWEAGVAGKKVHGSQWSKPLIVEDIKTDGISIKIFAQRPLSSRNLIGECLFSLKSMLLPSTTQLECIPIFNSHEKVGDLTLELEQVQTETESSSKQDNNHCLASKNGNDPIVASLKVVHQVLLETNSLSRRNECVQRSRPLQGAYLKQRNPDTSLKSAGLGSPESAKHPQLRAAQIPSELHSSNVRGRASEGREQETKGLELIVDQLANNDDNDQQELLEDSMESGLTFGGRAQDKETSCSRNSIEEPSPLNNHRVESRKIAEIEQDISPIPHFSAGKRSASPSLSPLHQKQSLNKSMDLGHYTEEENMGSFHLKEHIQDQSLPTSPLLATAQEHGNQQPSGKVLDEVDIYDCINRQKERNLASFGNQLPCVESGKPHTADQESAGKGLGIEDFEDVLEVDQDLGDYNFVGKPAKQYAAGSQCSPKQLSALSEEQTAKKNPNEVILHKDIVPAADNKFTDEQIMKDFSLNNSHSHHNNSIEEQQFAKNSVESDDERGTSNGPWNSEDKKNKDEMLDKKTTSEAEPESFWDKAMDSWLKPSSPVFEGKSISISGMNSEPAVNGEREGQFALFF